MAFRRLAATLVAGALACGLIGPAGAAAGPPVGIAQSFPTQCGVRELVAGPGGDIWFSCFETPDGSGGHAAIGRVTPTGEVVEFKRPLPANGEPTGIALGADGNIWVTLNSGLNRLPREEHGPAIARVTPAGQITVFQAGLGPTYSPGQPIAGPDGNIWFETSGPGRRRFVGSITPSGQITRYPVTVGSPEGRLGELTPGADGNLWFTKSATGGGALLVRLGPGGVMTEFGSQKSGFAPTEPVAGADGNLWFLERGKPEGIGRITPAGQVEEFNAGFDVFQATGLTAGPGDYLWFASQAPPVIGRITTAGKIDEFSECLFYGQLFFGPQTLVAGPDGNVWFTSMASRELPSISDPPSIGRITPGGAITQIYAGVKVEPRWIVAGADGAVWFSSGADEIQRIAPFTAPANTFRVGRSKEAKPNGATTLPLTVAGPGTIEAMPLELLRHGKPPLKISGPKLTANAETCIAPALPVRPVGAAARAFGRDGKAVERIAITFTPVGGTPYTKTVNAYFFHRRHRHRH